ncbi:MAG: metalloprotease TldD, partial [Roseinatronobacter sp.]|nr:metalloprotease TldD [Roseinatronobacter sp.]
MNDTDFRPFETAFDKESALAILREATAGADDGEIFVEKRVSESLLLDDQRIKSASYNAAEGFGLRAVRGEVAGYAHSTHMTLDALRRGGPTAGGGGGGGGGPRGARPPGPPERGFYEGNAHGG